MDVGAVVLDDEPQVVPDAVALATREHRVGRVGEVQPGFAQEIEQVALPRRPCGQVRLGQQRRERLGAATARAPGEQLPQRRPRDRLAHERLVQRATQLVRRVLGDVEQRAGWTRHRDAADAHGVAALERPGAVDDDALPPGPAAAGLEDGGGALRPREPPVRPGGPGPGEDGLGAAGEHGGERGPLVGLRRVTDAVDADLQPHELPAQRATPHDVAGEPRPQELGEGDDAVVVARQDGDPPVDRDHLALRRGRRR